MLRNLTNKMYAFIWDNKPDKVKRHLLCQDYYKGGLKMLNLKAFIQGLKLTWVRRLYNSNSALSSFMIESSRFEFHNRNFEITNTDVL